MPNIKQITPCRLSFFTLTITFFLPGPLDAQDFPNSIVSTDFDFITDEDPSAFKSLEFVHRVRAEMPDKQGRKELWSDAFEFSASFSDNTEVRIFVEAKGNDQKSARQEAMRYTEPLGKLPTALRQGVNRLCVHNGGEHTSASSDNGLIVVYSDNASVRISTHDLEETIFHESVHAAWDAIHAKSDGWKRAQMQDGNYVTVYARSKPGLEDLAETALFAYTIIHHPERLPKAVRSKLGRTIANRIFYIEQLIPEGEPIHFQVKKISAPSLSTEQYCNIRLPGVTADIISNCLLVQFKVSERRVQKVLAGAQDRYETSEDVFQAVIDVFDINPEELRQSIIANLHCLAKESGKFDKDFDDSELKSLIKSWKAKSELDD